MNKKVLRNCFILILLMWLSLSGQYVVVVDDLKNSFLLAFIDLLTYSVILMIVPLIFRIVNKKTLDYYYGQKICKYNSIIIFIGCILLNIFLNDGNYIGIGGVGALIYYYINMSIFVSSKNNLVDTNNVSDTHKNNRLPLYILTVVFGIIALIIVLSVCLTLSNNTPHTTIKNNVSDDMFVIEEDGIKVYNASHILVEDIETALEVISKLDKGIDFAYLAQQYSIDATSNKGGYLGNFYEGEMVEEFETAVSFLDINEYTNTPVKTDYGYHIIIRHKPE